MALSTLDLVLSARVTEALTVNGIARSLYTTFEQNDNFTSGVSLDQSDKVLSLKGQTVAAAATATHDLVSLATDTYGQALSFAKIKGLFLFNRSTTAGDILRVGAGSNPVGIFADTTDAIDVGPGGIFFWSDPSLAGVAVTGGASDTITIVEQGAVNTVTYDLLTWGTSS